MTQLKINNQEIYLLSQYISASYFKELLDEWRMMVNGVEKSLSSYMNNLSPNHRIKPLPEQADIVWGERVLPNFRDTYDSLKIGYVKLCNGDKSGLSHANGPLNDSKGQADFSIDWMDEEAQSIYNWRLERAISIAGNIAATEGAYWRPGILTRNFSEWDNGDPHRTIELPRYSLNHAVRLTSGQPASRPGIFIPDVADSCPQFIGPSHIQVPEAMVRVGIDYIREEDGTILDEVILVERRPCTWTLVAMG